MEDLQEDIVPMIDMMIATPEVEVVDLSDGCDRVDTVVFSPSVLEALEAMEKKDKQGKQSTIEKVIEKLLSGRIVSFLLTDKPCHSSIDARESFAAFASDTTATVSTFVKKVKMKAEEQAESMTKDVQANPDDIDKENHPYGCFALVPSGTEEEDRIKKGFVYMESLLSESKKSLKTIVEEAMTMSTVDAEPGRARATEDKTEREAVPEVVEETEQGPKEAGLEQEDMVLSMNSQADVSHITTLTIFATFDDETMKRLERHALGLDKGPLRLMNSTSRSAPKPDKSPMHSTTEFFAPSAIVPKREEFPHQAAPAPSGAKPPKPDGTPKQSGRSSPPKPFAASKLASSIPTGAKPPKPDSTPKLSGSSSPAPSFEYSRPSLRFRDVKPPRPDPTPKHFGPLPLLLPSLPEYAGSHEPVASPKVIDAKTFFAPSRQPILPEATPRSRICAF